MADSIEITVIEAPIDVSVAVTETPTDVSITIEEALGEAPIDGEIYGRKDAAWVVVVSSVAETDPIFLASPAFGIDAGDIASWDAKQNALSIGAPANGLSFVSDVLALGLASAGVTGALSGADWSTFNNKQPALPVVDTQAIVKGSADPTKLLRFEVDGFTTGETRVLTPPNADATIAGLEVANVFTVNQTVDAHATVGLSSASAIAVIHPLSETTISTLGIGEEFTGNPGTTIYIDAITAAQIANPSVDSTISFFQGLAAGVITQAANSKNIRGLTGVWGSVNHKGSGNITQALGLAFTVKNTGAGNIGYLAGMQTTTAHNSSGQSATVYGHYNYVENYGGGTTDELYGSHIDIWLNGTTTTAYGSRISLTNDGSITTTAYGLYIDTVDPGSTNYAIYTNGGLIRLGGALTLANYTSNGFLKTSGGGGTVSVDTAAYVDTASANWIDLTDGGATTLHSHAGASVAWGSITGTLSGQTDLQAALDAKQNSLGFTPVDIASANYVDLTDGGATTLHSHAGGSGDVIDSGVVVGQLTKGVTDSKHITAAAIIPPASNILTLTNAAASTLALAITAAKTLTLTAVDNYNLTIPATGTAALLATANIFSAAQKINVNSTTALFVEQDGVKDDTFIVDTTNGRVGVGVAPTLGNMHVKGVSGVGTRLIAQATGTTSSDFADFDFYGSDGNVKGAFRYVPAGGTAYGGADSINFIQVLAAPLTFGTNNIVRMVIDLLGNIGIGGISGKIPVPLAPFHPSVWTNTTNAVFEVVRLESNVALASTGGAAGFGVSQTLWAETATDLTNKQQGRLWSKWIVPTNGSETAAVGLDAYYNSTAREFISGEATTTAVKLAFFGGTRAIQQVLAAYTADAESGAYTGAADGEAKLADLNALRVAYENLRASYDDLRTKLQTSTLVA